MRSRGHWIMKTLALGVALLVVTSVAFTRSRRGHSDSGLSHVILAFGTMYGVDGGFVGTTTPIRDVVGDELPWKIESATGVLTTDGRLRIRVRGLVFTDDIEVPPELQGINDETQFRAKVSCLSEDATTGAVTTAGVTTAGFAASTEGDSDIDAHVQLPNPCVAPIVFILAGSEDKWFAVTGFEAEVGTGGGNGDDHHDDHNGGDDDHGD